jgi:hypothetical protein
LSVIATNNGTDNITRNTLIQTPLLKAIDQVSLYGTGFESSVIHVRRFVHEIEHGAANAFLDTQSDHRNGLPSECERIFTARRRLINPKQSDQRIQSVRKGDDTTHIFSREHIPREAGLIVFFDRN